MPIIYQKNPSELIPQGNRTVSTFPSGLVRVDQSFIGLTSLESTHRNQLQIGEPFPAGSDPSIDGLSIFPAIQEKRLPDGFTEYIVSAYGRTNKSGNSYLVPGLEFVSMFVYFSKLTQTNKIAYGFFRGYDLISTRVIREDILDDEIYREIPTPDLIRVFGAPIEGGYSIVSLTNYLQIINKDIKRTNYGKFSELTILRGYVQYQGA
jgi:hypothetical protein